MEVAKKAFARAGTDVSLDDIVRQAGVGGGTLYRHFPTRDALIEAVYRSEVEKLAAKLIIAQALNSVVGGVSKLYEGSRGKVAGFD